MDAYIACLLRQEQCFASTLPVGDRGTIIPSLGQGKRDGGMENMVFFWGGDDIILGDDHSKTICSSFGNRHTMHRVAFGSFLGI